MPKRKKAMTRTLTEHPAPTPMPFPFMKLPAEIRNLIYQQCLSVERHRLSFSMESPVMLHINTALLSVCKQVYTEIIPLLYSGSMTATIDCHHLIPIRVDQATRGTHTLRNGKRVSMTSHSGRVYSHVFARFRKIVLHVNVTYLFRYSALMMNASARLELQIDVVLEAFKSALKASPTGPRVQELEINLDHGGLVSSILLERTGLECAAEFERVQKRLLMPFHRLCGLQSVNIVGVPDEEFVNELKRTMEGDGPHDRAAWERLFLLTYPGFYD